MNIVIEFPAKSVPVKIKIGAPEGVTRMVNMKNAVEIEGHTRLGTRSLSAAKKLVGGETRVEVLTRLQREIQPHVELAE